jgi:hypothetical protein
VPCYYRGCDNQADTKEHVPPKAFFPKDQRDQLLTVPSCKSHNNSKTNDDTYVLTHICMNASPSNGAREIFSKKILPQLGYNDDAFRKMLLKGSEHYDNGTGRYHVDVERFDDFFTALSMGIVYKTCGGQLPNSYSIGHIYHNFQDDNENPEYKTLKGHIGSLYSGTPLHFLDFGQPDTRNEKIYTVKLFGVPGFCSSITVDHLFFGSFRVTSMLSKKWGAV